jgi:nucleolin
MGNLAWTIDEAALGEAFADCGEIVSVNWFEEKATGKFLGAGVVEFKTAEAAAAAVAATGRLVHKRETPVRFWEKRGNTAEERAAAKAAGGGGRAEIKPMGEKPEGCYTLFMGNLNFQIDDDTIYKFFMDGAGVGPHTIRWLTNKETGEFRGVGFADFSGAEIDAAAKLHGEKCMGRPIRLDWQAPSNRG